MNKTIRQSLAIVALTGTALMATTVPTHAQTPNTAQETQQGNQATPGKGQWLTIKEVYDKLTVAGYTDIREIERERGGYEAKVRDNTGRKAKLYIDPRTGDVINRGKHYND